LPHTVHDRTQNWAGSHSLSQCSHRRYLLHTPTQHNYPIVTSKWVACHRGAHLHLFTEPPSTSRSCHFPNLRLPHHSRHLCVAKDSPHHCPCHRTTRTRQTSGQQTTNLDATHSIPITTFRHQLGFGVPIPDEWFPRRYKLTKVIGLETKSSEKERAMATELLETTCEEVCKETRPGGWTEIGTITVCCLQRGETKIYPLLQVGSICTFHRSMS